MKSRNWSRKSVLVCGVISLLARGVAAAQAAPAAQATPAAPAKSPAIVLVDGADAAQWQTWTRDLGWQVIVPAAEAANANPDARVQALTSVVEAAIRNAGVDAERVYLAGRGSAAAVVFYAISRVPDLWAAGIALGGSPKAAIDTNRLFSANFTNVPVLWIGESGDQALAEKLKSAGLNLEWRLAKGVTNGDVFQWLAGHQRDQFPAAIDCETNSPAFARCYWIRMAKFDPSERNDVLPSTRLAGGSGAALDLGAFGYSATDAGPGVLVSHLPEKYSGPLKMGDRIVALDGKPIQDARQFAETMEQMVEEKAVVALVQRGKERIRVETRIVLPPRDSAVTARVQAQYSPAEKEIQIISRTVTEMRVTVPPAWTPAKLYWNGLSLEDLKTPGCYALTVEKELLHAAPCEN
jgi:predicted esterase